MIMSASDWFWIAFDRKRIYRCVKSWTKDRNERHLKTIQNIFLTAFVFDEKLTINIFLFSLFLGEYQSFIYRNGVYCESTMPAQTLLKAPINIKWYCISQFYFD